MAFVVIATWTARPEEAEHVLAGLTELLPTNRAEPKNLAFEINRSLDEPNVFVLYEVYTDESGWVEHRESEPFQRIAVADLMPRLESRVAKTYELQLPSGLVK